MIPARTENDTSVRWYPAATGLPARAPDRARQAAAPWALPIIMLDFKMVAAMAMLSA